MESELEQIRAENTRLKTRQEEVFRLFATNIPFELRTPLAAIRGLSDLILQDSGNLTDQQKEYLSQIQSANETMICAIDFVADYARYGFTKADEPQKISLLDFEQIIFDPIREFFAGSEKDLITIFKSFSLRVNQYGIRADSLALTKAIDRIFRELFSYRNVDQIKVRLNNKNENLHIQIQAPIELRTEPLHRTIYQNYYDQGHIDLAVQAIIELYDGQVESRVENGIAIVQIQLPLVKLDI